MPGTLYLVAVPIGNLGDLTRRALEVLQAATVVAAEDVPATRRLLSHLGVSARVVSYREAGREAAGEAILEVLRGGGSVALVSEAGTPGISDPGRDLVERCHAEGVPVSPVPGPSALTAALSASGLPGRRVAFEGFLPRAGRARRDALEALVRETRTVALFEAPHRVLRTLEDLLEALGDRRAFLGRELTKKFEECRLDTLSGLLERFRREAPRGECVLILEGSSEPEEGEVREGEAGEEARWLRGKGLRTGEVAEFLSRFRGLPRKEAYRVALEQARDDEDGD